MCEELSLWSEAGQEAAVFPVEVLQAVQSPQNTLEGEKWENHNSISSGSLGDNLILCSWSSFLSIKSLSCVLFPFQHPLSELHGKYEAY